MREPATHRPARSRRPLPTVGEAFTLIELTVVVAVIAVLIGLLAPSVKGIIERGRMAACGSNLHQMGVAQLQFASNQINQGRYVSGPFNVDSSPIPNPECVWVNIAPPTGYPYGGYRSHGVLLSRGLLKPEVMYCPSWDIDTWLPGKGDTTTGRCGWVPGDEATISKYWVLNDQTTASGASGKPAKGVIALSSIVSTYFTRTTFIEPEVKVGNTVIKPSFIRPAQMGSDGEGEALMSEAFYRPYTADDGSAKVGYYPVHENVSGTNSGHVTHTGVVGTVFMDNHVDMVNPVNKAGQKVCDAFYEGVDWKADKEFYGNIESIFNNYLSRK